MTSDDLKFHQDAADYHLAKIKEINDMLERQDQIHKSKENCSFCNGTRFISAGHGLIGTVNCGFCNGTGKQLNVELICEANK